MHDTADFPCCRDRIGIHHDVVIGGCEPELCSCCLQADCNGLLRFRSPFPHSFLKVFEAWGLEEDRDDPELQSKDLPELRKPLDIHDVEGDGSCGDNLFKRFPCRSVEIPVHLAPLEHLVVDDLILELGFTQELVAPSRLFVAPHRPARAGDDFLRTQIAEGLQLLIHRILSDSGASGEDDHQSFLLHSVISQIPLLKFTDPVRIPRDYRIP